MPMPVSLMVRVLFSLSTVTMTDISLSSSGFVMRYFVIASQPLLTTSRRKMSLSEYSQRLMTGIIFLGVNRHRALFPFQSPYIIPPRKINGNNCCSLSDRWMYCSTISIEMQAKISTQRKKSANNFSDCSLFFARETLPLARETPPFPLANPRAIRYNR